MIIWVKNDNGNMTKIMIIIIPDRFDGIHIYVLLMS
jgi:hypothetical protein